MIKQFVPSQLAAAPADVDYKCDTRSEPGVWFECANLSPYAFELQDDGGQIRAIAGPFNYAAFPLAAITQFVRLHVIGTQSSTPLPAAAWTVYVGLTKRPMKGVPDIG